MHESDARKGVDGFSSVGGLLATRSHPKLLAQGKPRTLGGSTRPWRVRLYVPGPGSNKYQVYFKAPAGEGEP